MKQEDIDELSAKGMTVVHLTPAYDPKCKHEWEYSTSDNDPPGSEPQQDEEPTHCKLCGISWTRYIFTQCP